jgi:hypothetical protein
MQQYDIYSNLDIKLKPYGIEIENRNKIKRNTIVFLHQNLLLSSTFLKKSILTSQLSLI